MVAGGALKKSKSQGDHGKCGANYRCCIPALTGFVSPHSVGPGKIYGKRLSGLPVNQQADLSKLLKWAKSIQYHCLQEVRLLLKTKVVAQILSDEFSLRGLRGW